MVPIFFTITNEIQSQQRSTCRVFRGTTLRTVSQHILQYLWTSNGQLIVDYRNSNGPQRLKRCVLSIFRGNHDLYDLTKMKTLWRCVISTRTTPSAPAVAPRGPKFFRWSRGRFAMAEQLKFWRRCQTGSQQLTLCLRNLPKESFPLRDLWQHERPNVYIYIYLWYIYIWYI